MDKKTLVALLKKRAEGFMIEEVSEEFALVDGVEKVVKRKVSSKFIPPDLNALKLLIDIDNSNQDDCQQLSFEELLEEKNKILNLLGSGEAAG